MKKRSIALVSKLERVSAKVAYMRGVEDTFATLQDLIHAHMQVHERGLQAAMVVSDYGCDPATAFNGSVGFDNLLMALWRVVDFGQAADTRTRV